MTHIKHTLFGKCFGVDRKNVDWDLSVFHFNPLSLDVDCKWRILTLWIRGSFSPAGH